MKFGSGSWPEDLPEVLVNQLGSTVLQGLRGHQEVTGHHVRYGVLQLHAHQHRGDGEQPTTRQELL